MMNIVETNLKPRWALTNRTKTDMVVIHHSASSTGDAYSFDQMHKAPPRNWNMLAYHFIVLKDGTVQLGRPISAVGGHTIGHNDHTIGICCVGSFDKEFMGEPQLTALIELVRYLKGKYPGIKVKGHRDLQATECPGDNLYKLLDLINKESSENDVPVYPDPSTEVGRAAQWVISQKISDGLNSKSNCTREEIWVMLYRALGPKDTPGSKGF